MYEVYLKKGEERRILSGHSWVYANEVQEIKGKDKMEVLPPSSRTIKNISGKDISIICRKFL